MEGDAKWLEGFSTRMPNAALDVVLKELPNNESLWS